MSKILRSDGPKLMLAFVGVLMILSYYIQWAPVNDFSSLMIQWASICAPMGGAIAYINLLRRNVRSITRRDEKTWIPSLFGLVTMVIGLAIGLVYTYRGDMYQAFYNMTYRPINVALVGLFIFYITSASYRTFRVRNTEMAVLLGSTIFIMLSNAPIGAALWSGFPAGGNWIMRVANTAGQRALVITATAGVAVFGLRLLLGYELAQKVEESGESVE